MQMIASRLITNPRSARTSRTTIRTTSRPSLVAPSLVAAARPAAVSPAPAAKMQSMSKKRDRLRFSFTLPVAEDRNLTSGGWRIWTKGDDVYITLKEVGGIWKVSLHGDEAWRCAITQEHAEGESPVIPSSEDRAPWTFTPPPFVDGRRLAFIIACTRGCLRTLPIDPTQVHVLVRDRWDEMALVYLVMTEYGVTEPAPLVRTTRCTGSRLLPRAAGTGAPSATRTLCSRPSYRRSPNFP